jgi:hypothetical protein
MGRKVANESEQQKDYQVPLSHGDGTSLAKEARNEAVFDLLNLKKDSCSVSIQQFGTLPPLETVLLCGP